jgi:hypothetical protein
VGQVPPGADGVPGASSFDPFRWRVHALRSAVRRRPRRACRGTRCPRRRTAPRIDLDAGDDHRARRDQAPRRRPAAEQPAGRRQDAGHRLGGAVLQPLRADRAARARRGHAVRPGGRGRALLPLLRLHQRGAAHGARLHVRDGRPARLRRLHGLSGLGRPGRAGRRQGRRRVGRHPPVVDRPRRHVRQVLRRRHGAHGRRVEAHGAQRRRLAGAGLRHVPLPVLQPGALRELAADAGALHGDRPDAGFDPGRPGLQRQRSRQHRAPRLLRAELPRAAERRPQARPSGRPAT